MGIINIFKKKQVYKTNNNEVNEVHRMSEQSQKEVEEADKEIALLANAYDNYEKDGDLNRVINVYERCLTLDSESKWNSFYSKSPRIL